jgi:transcriptional regulator with XRE-family HTH domain
MVRGRKSIPNRLWKYRKLMGYSQTDIAIRLGHKDTSRISRWENGFTMPSGKNLLQLSILYKTLVNELYFELSTELRQNLFSRNGKENINGIHKSC